MVDIQIGRVGKIIEGDYIGNEVKVIDDSDSTGGFLILTSTSFSGQTEEGFDDWVENRECLVEYFKESRWVIEWL